MAPAVTHNKTKSIYIGDTIRGGGGGGGCCHEVLPRTSPLHPTVQLPGTLVGPGLQLLQP